MPRLPGYRSILPDRAERRPEQSDAVFRQPIRARDNHTNGARVNQWDFGFYFSFAKGIRNDNESVEPVRPRCVDLRLSVIREAGRLRPSSRAG